MLARILFPKNCKLCSKDGAVLCSDCLKLLKRSLAIYYYEFGLDAVLASFERSNRDLWRLLYGYKYGADRDLRIVFARLFAELILSNRRLLEDVVFTYIPSSRKHLQERSFDHMQMCLDTLKEFGFETAELLRSTKKKSQVGLTRKERISNVRGHYSVRRSCKNYKICLLDDVLTTGASMEECARVLRASGAVQVFGLVLCV